MLDITLNHKHMTAKTKYKPFKIPHGVTHEAGACARETS